jgi:hypothetical protein
MRPQRGRFERGVVVQFEVSADRVVEAGAELIEQLGNIVGVPGDTTITVATLDKASSPSRSFLLRDVTVSRFARLCDEGDPFWSGSLGSDRVEVAGAPMSSGMWSLTAIVAATHEPGESTRLLELIDFCASPGNGMRLVSGGADVGPKVDSQEHAIFPYNRGEEKWPRLLERNAVCGYYWLTLLGERSLAQLPAPPEGLPVQRSGDITFVQLSDLPEGSAQIRSYIPALREWLLPVLPGWMVGNDPGFDARLYEGPIVPTEVAYRLAAVAEGRADSAWIDQQVATLGVSSDDLVGGRRLEFSITPVRPEDADAAAEGLLGTVAAVQRGLVEGWLDAEPFGELDLTEYSVEVEGSAESMRLLLYALHRLLDGHCRSTKDGLVPLAELGIVSVDVVDGTGPGHPA